MVMKLDLAKSYDKVNLTFLRLVLLKLSLSLEVVNWIMGCVSSTKFHGAHQWISLRFFKASWA
jgi:hypothetical protein